MSAMTDTDIKIFNFILHKLGITLNEGQKAMAIPNAEPTICSAVPGAGKTTVLTIRVSNEELIAKIPGNQIYVITFTNKATNEFRDRHQKVMKKIDSKLKSKVNVSTIHSFCKKFVQIFHVEAGFNKVETMNEEDAFKSLKRIISVITNRDLNAIGTDEVMNIEGCIAFLNNRLIFDRNEVTKTYQFIELGIPYEIFEQIRDNYRRSQRNSGKLSFDEWQSVFYELLKNNERIRTEIQSRISSLFVDEFQDTTPLQFEIIRMLKKETTSLTVVGDQDQSVYRWRGATNIYKWFMDAYPNCRHIKMDVNYRCPDYIIDSSNGLIRNNTQRLPVTAKGTGKKGKLKIIQTTSNQVASLEIAKMIIEDYEKSGRDNYVLMDKLVLYRNHSQGMFICYELARHKVPIVTGNVQLPHKDKIVKDMFAIVDMLTHPRSSERAHKCMHLVSTQLRKPKTKEGCPFYNSTEKEAFWEIPINVGNQFVYQDEIRELREIRDLIKQDKPAKQIFRRLLPMYFSAYYLRYNIHNLIGKTEEDVRAIENFLVDGTVEDYTVDQLEYVLTQVERFLIESNKDTVGLKVLSIHGAKGLEAETVYHLDWNGMAQPNPRVIETLLDNRAYTALEDYINEERSLAYVALTRSTKNTVMTYNVDNPSPFNIESGINKELRAKKGILTLEKLGVPKHYLDGGEVKNPTNNEHALQLLESLKNNVPLTEREVKSENENRAISRLGF